MDLSLWHPLGFLDRFFNLDFTSFVRFVDSNKLVGLSQLSAQLLSWDSVFFEADIFKINFVEEPDFTREILVNQLISNRKDRWNIFAEVPSEAISQIRFLNELGFSLIETRLNYYNTLERIPEDIRKSRSAELEDITHLKKVASGAINDFDKYHADPFFSIESTNRYLETYIENCVKGFAERVFVPDLPSEPASFVAVSRLKDPVWRENEPIFRIPLTACLPENKGWHYPLCIAALNYAKVENAKCLVMTTQSTNRAVIHNCEKLGFKLGSCTHIFSLSNQ